MAIQYLWKKYLFNTYLLGEILAGFLIFKIRGKRGDISES